MSDSQPSKVFMFDNTDPEMQRAYENARSNFRYFWREVAWERRRIVPALDVACVKAPFSDGEPNADGRENSDVEQMWLGEIDFDGKFVSGVLLNSPNGLKSVRAGDSARMRLAEITDWMYAIGGEVYGAYTVNLMRSRMDKRERKEHDKLLWGMNFGDPNSIRLVPQKKSWFGKREGELEEHPDERSDGTLVQGTAPRRSFAARNRKTTEDGHFCITSARGEHGYRKGLARIRGRDRRRDQQRNDANATRQVARLGQSRCAPGKQRSNSLTMFQDFGSCCGDLRDAMTSCAADDQGMVLCNPRDREAAHRAEMEGIATEDRAAVTCRKCLGLLFERDKRRMEGS